MTDTETMQPPAQSTDTPPPDTRYPHGPIKPTLEQRLANAERIITLLAQYIALNERRRVLETGEGGVETLAVIDEILEMARIIQS